MNEMEWHNDGHSIELSLDGSEVKISTTHCPNKGACKHQDAACVVDWFLQMYGIEVNVGACEITGNIPIAWTFIPHNAGLEFSRLWIIPTDDISFAAWYGAINE
jgi:hypothetical protein